MHPRAASAPFVLLLSLCLASCAGADGDGDADGPVSEPAATAEAPASGSVGELPQGAEAVGFLGDTLYPPDLPPQVLETYQARYAEAERALEATPENVDSLIWMGRRTAYLGRYREAIDIYSYALELHPDEPRLYRHRGHRYVTVRDLDRAVADFRRAVDLVEGTEDRVEPDGLPNARGIPTSTLQFNIWYHLGLAHYLAGDFELAAEAYAACARVSEHPDSKVATAYWRYLTLRRLGRDAEAESVLAGIGPDMDIIESTAYLDLLLLYKGEGEAEALLGPSGDDATLQSTTAAYGVGMWHLLRGEEAEAEGIFRRIHSARDQWPAFGYIAAEAELAGLGAR